MAVVSLLAAVPGLTCRTNAQTTGSTYSSPRQKGLPLGRQFARDFKCGKDEVKMIGETGAAVGLARR
jgi:hypothetical protein